MKSVKVVLGVISIATAVAVVPMLVGADSQNKSLEVLTKSKPMETVVVPVVNAPSKVAITPTVTPKDVVSCDCEFAGLTIVPAMVQRVYLDKETHTIMADTVGEVLGHFTVSLTPQRHETLDQMVHEFKGNEICIGFVGDATSPDTVEVVWALLSSVD